MIDREHKLSVVRQAKLLGFSRGSVYYLPRPVSDGDLALMRRIDELHLDYPFAGSRMLQGLLRGEGLETGRRHVATLMKKMGIEAIYRRPNTSKPAPGHKIYPYLLRKLAVTRPNQVWAMDLTYIPMARGFVYLCAVVDWFSRKVLSWRLSITMEAAFCIEAVEEYARSIGLNYHSQVELLRHGKVVAFFEARINELQRSLAKYEQVKKFTLLPRPFSMELGELTPTLKLRRKAIEQAFGAEIEAMYR